MNTRHLTMTRLAPVALLCLELAASLFAAEKPEDLLLAAKKNMAGRPWKIQVLVQGENGAKVAGIIRESDFDLTVTTKSGESRQIAIGNQGWVSTDGGQDWRKAKSIDRRYYYLAHTPINYKAGEHIPPFEKVASFQEGADSMVQLRFISPEPVHHEGDRPNHWIVLNDGQPDVIRRYAGYLVFERDHVGTQVSYAPLDDAERILPPPGNKIAIPDESGPDALLAAALRQMQTGIWEVDATITMQNKLRVHGLLADTDCDLTLDAENGKDIREIILKGKNWGSFDGGNSWKSLPANDKLIYSWVHTPILYQISLPPFEIVDKEPRDGETWVHLRLKVTGPNTDKAERSHYWIAIDGNGKPDGVRQHEGFLVSRDKMDQPVKCEATYRRAAATAAIKPPPDGDAAKTGDAGRKIPAQNSKTLSLLDGKLTLDVPADFVREPAKKGDRKSLAKFARKDGAWGEVLRGTNGLTPDALPGYLKKRVEEYSKSFDWLPPDLHIEWLRKEIVTFNGREWADWRFVPMGKDSKEYQSSPVYTRFLTTSYKGQLLEVTFTTNLNTEPSLKKEIDAIMDSVRLED